MSKGKDKRALWAKACAMVLPYLTIWEKEKLENELMITKVSLIKWPMDEENISPALRALMVAFESPLNWHMKANSDCNKDSLMNDTLNSHFYWIAIGGWFPWRINGGLVPSKNY